MRWIANPELRIVAQRFESSTLRFVSLLIRQSITPIGKILHGRRKFHRQFGKQPSNCLFFLSITKQNTPPLRWRDECRFFAGVSPLFLFSDINKTRKNFPFSQKSGILKIRNPTRRKWEDAGNNEPCRKIPHCERQ